MNSPFEALLQRPLMTTEMATETGYKYVFIQRATTAAKQLPVAILGGLQYLEAKQLPVAILGLKSLKLWRLCSSLRMNFHQCG
nr:hypothetical protein Iba_chr01fCG7680 [Ipomoea batatas]GME04985.1 hypothetical protein Iba_scaffold2431CG0050 [Ipomoea batatas]